MSTSYERMLNQQMSTSFWGVSSFQQRFKSHLEDKDKTREQADDIETAKQVKYNGTTTATHISAHI